MAGEIDALGAFTTAGLAASTLDGPTRHTAGKATGHFPELSADAGRAACANCGTPLAGEFCHACGQVGHVHRSVGHILEEFLHGLYHFDSKAWRTLPLLAFRPGKLTYDYVHGKRARYIAPLALFLLSVFVMFLVFGLIGGPDINRAIAASSGPTKAASHRAVADLRGEVAASERAVAAAKAARTDSSDLRALSLELSANRAALDGATRQLARTDAPAGATPVAAKPWKDQLADWIRSGDGTINFGNATINARVRDALLNPDFALYRIEQKAYKLSFLLVPLSLPILWLTLFWKRDVRVYDHVIFALYSLSFMSLLFIVIALLLKFGGPALTTIGWMLLLVPPVHMYAQLKGGYRLGWFGALWRTSVLSIASIITLAMFATLIVVLGLAD